MLDTKLNGKIVHEEAQEMSNADTHVQDVPDIPDIPKEDSTPKKDSQHVEWSIGEDDAGYEIAIEMYKILDKRFIKFSARKKLERLRKRERALNKKMQKLFEQFDAEDGMEMQINAADHPEIMNLSIEIALAKIQYRHGVFSLGLQETLDNMEELGESMYLQCIEQGIDRADLFKDTLHTWINLPTLNINDEEVRESYDAAQDFYYNAVETLMDKADRVDIANCVESHPFVMEWGDKFIQLMDLEEDIDDVRSHGETQEMSNADTPAPDGSDITEEDSIPKDSSQHIEWKIRKEDDENDAGYETGYEAALSIYKTLDKRFVKFSARKKLKHYRKCEKILTKKRQRLLEQFNVDDEMQNAKDHPEITDLTVWIAMTRIHYRHDVFALGLLAILENKEFDESEYPQLIEKGLVLSELFKETLRAWSMLPIFDINNKDTLESYRKEYAFHFNTVSALIDMADCVVFHPSAMEWAKKFRQLITAEDRRNMDSLIGALPWHTSKQ